MLWLCSCSETCRWRSRWGLSQARANHPQKEAAFRVCTHYPNTLAQKGQNPHRGELGKERHAAGEALHKSPWRRKAEKASPLSQSRCPRKWDGRGGAKMSYNGEYFVDRPQAHTQEPGCPRCHSYRTRKSRCARAEKYGVNYCLGEK